MCQYEYVCFLPGFWDNFESQDENSKAFKKALKLNIKGETDTDPKIGICCRQLYKSAHTILSTAGEQLLGCLSFVYIA